MSMADTGVMDKLTMATFLRFVDAYGQKGCHQLIAEGYPPKVVYDRAKRAASKGYYEYGVSIPYGWITPEGRTFLGAQRDGREEV